MNLVVVNLFFKRELSTFRQKLTLKMQSRCEIIPLIIPLKSLYLFVE